MYKEEIYIILITIFFVRRKQLENLALPPPLHITLVYILELFNPSLKQLIFYNEKVPLHTTLPYIPTNRK